MTKASSTVSGAGLTTTLHPAARAGAILRKDRVCGKFQGTTAADWETCTLDVVGHLRLAAGRYPDDPRLTSLIGELAMGSERFRRLWARADVRARTHGRKAYRHPLIGLLELHQESFALPDETGMELLVLSSDPGSPAEDGLRLLAGLGSDGDGTDADLDVLAPDRPDTIHPPPEAPPR